MNARRLVQHDMIAEERTSILIPTYRSADIACECLESLQASVDFKKAEVIVIDDASKDGPAERIEKRFPDAIVVHRGSNGGYAKAVNDGFTRASPSREFVAVLNDDTVVDRGWLNHAVAALDANPRLGSVAPMITLYNDTSILDSAGLCYSISGWAYRRGHGKPVAPPYTEPEPVFGPTGCALVLRREALAGGEVLFREDLECYYEDIDLAFRLRRSGWSCHYVPDVVVRHRVSHSYERLASRKAFCVSRNIELIFWTYMPRHLMWWAVPHHLLLVLLQAVRSAVYGQLRPYIAGKAAVATSVAETRRRRARLSPVADLDRWIERSWLRQAVATGRPRRG